MLVDPPDRRGYCASLCDRESQAAGWDNDTNGWRSALLLWRTTKMLVPLAHANGNNSQQGVGTGHTRRLCLSDFWAPPLQLKNWETAITLGPQVRKSRAVLDRILATWCVSDCLVGLVNDKGAWEILARLIELLHYNRLLLTHSKCRINLTLYHLWFNCLQIRNQCIVTEQTTLSICWIAQQANTT